MATWAIQHETSEDALASWPKEIERLHRLGRERQAKRLANKLKRLRGLAESCQSICQFMTVYFACNPPGEIGEIMGKKLRHED